jgi:shikimate kinase
VLIGMMGAGKSTVGSELAARLGWRLVDSDAHVEARTGRTVAEIWATEGEPAFRRLEALALTEALAATAEEPAVIAAAGGVVLDPANRALLRQHPPVVWLRARLDTLAERVGTGSGRPLLAGDPRGALARLLAERAPLYAEVAVDDRSPDEVADHVLDAVAEAVR